MIGPMSRGAGRPRLHVSQTVIAIIQVLKVSRDSSWVPSITQD